MTPFSQYAVADLEQDIIKMFNVTELLKEFVRQYIDGERIMSQDEVANYLDGIARVHELQCERLWDGLDVMIRNKRFAYPQEETPKKRKNK
jgi:hypothetical protein